jgi:hypothetical protein
MRYELNPPASPENVRSLRDQFPNLPSEYFEFLLRSDGGEGFLGIRPGYFQLWASHEVVHFSSMYQVTEYLPAYLAVGSSGGGELFILAVSGSPAGIFCIDPISLKSEDVVLVAPNFAAFVSQFGGDWNPDTEELKR